MFVVTRGRGETFIVGDVLVRVVGTKGDHVELALDAPMDVPLWWEEGGDTNEPSNGEEPKSGRAATVVGS
jgi:sRNA-binding carbon storage regulator CsrA